MKRLVIALLLVAACGGEKQKPVVVGSKNFTESVILGELAAQTLERAGCTVDRRLNMGGTFVCDTAIRSGAIDVYAEYSGTAFTAILKQQSTSDRTAVDNAVRDAYAKAGLTWSPALGFNNTFAMIVRRADADRLGLKTVSDLHKVAATYQPGFGYEFTERPDGWPGLQKAYGFAFAKPPRTMDLGLTYKAVAAGEVDLIAGNSTDGLIDPLGLVILADDKRFFPPYDAVIVRRADMPKKCGDALEALRATIDDAAMRKLNYEVDGQKREVAEVVKEWLAER